MLIKLYLNDPLGRKCSNIDAAVKSLKGKYSFEVEVVTKNAIVNPPVKFPSVEIDGQLVFEAVDVSVEDLEREILKRLPKQCGSQQCCGH
jgi:hypothetical protein